MVQYPDRMATIYDAAPLTREAFLKTAITGGLMHLINDASTCIMPNIFRKQE